MHCFSSRIRFTETTWSAGPDRGGLANRPVSPAPSRYKEDRRRSKCSDLLKRALEGLPNCHCYENSRPPPHAVIPAKAGIQSQALGFQSTLERPGAHTFIPLCGLRKAIVIPNVATVAEPQAPGIAGPAPTFIAQVSHAKILFGTIQPDGRPGKRTWPCPPLTS